MKIGTKSVLFGAHCFFLHPLFVAWGWYRLYGWRRVPLGRVVRYAHICGEVIPYLADLTTALYDPRLWFAFFLHDIGYLHCSNMDGDEGKQHPYRGATLMEDAFGTEWYAFMLFHSRAIARQYHSEPSALCYADKLAYPLTPRWLYLAQVNATGEIDEYMANANIQNTSRAAQLFWHATVSDSLRDFAATHR
jgi:hypothetical protein